MSSLANLLFAAIDDINIEDYLERCVLPVTEYEEGLASFLETVKNVQTSLNPNLEVGGILLTMYQGQTNLCRGVREDIYERYGNLFRVFTSPITYSVKVAEHPALQKSIFSHDSKNPAAIAYMEMAKEVLSYGEKRACS